jgi:hypothetical protein
MVGITAEQRKWRRQYDPTGQTSGDVPTSDGAGGIVWSAPSSGAERIEAFKTVDQAKVSDNTLNADNAISFVFDPNSHYRVESMIQIEQVNATPDFKWQWLSFTGTWWAHWEARSMSVISGAPAATDTAGAIGHALNAATVINNGGGQVALLHFDILVHSGGSSNNFFLNWAQNVANVNATTVKAGSWAIATKIA